MDKERVSKTCFCIKNSQRRGFQSCEAGKQNYASTEDDRRNGEQLCLQRMFMIVQCL